jgi:uncharacterized protein (DUF1499 family)
MRKRLVLIPAVTVLVLVAATLAMVLASRRPGETGLVDGRLRPCPPKPNCVCSQDTDEHAIEPLRFAGDPDEAWTLLELLVRAERLAEVVAVEGDYLHAVWRTPLLGFRDDVEFLLDRESACIHVRSASRVGHSDLGANRERVDAMRARWRPPGPDD